MVAWNYIDKGAATVAAMRDFHDMKALLRLTPDEIRELGCQMAQRGVALMADTPRHTDPQKGEEKLARGLDKMDALRERYRQARGYMDWFEPSWQALTDEEREILREFYMCGNLRSGAGARLEVRLGYSHAQIDRLRARALERFSFLLFGR